MAKSVNKVILLGHLGRDPDPHTTPGGRLVVNFTVATNRARRDPNGTQVEETEWFRVAVWDQLAQTAVQYLRKGAKIYLEGRLQTRRYVDRDNVERTAIEVVASDFVMLDRRPDDSDGGCRAGGPIPVPPPRALPPYFQALPAPPAYPVTPDNPVARGGTPLAVPPPAVVAPTPPPPLAPPPFYPLPPGPADPAPTPRSTAANEEGYAIYDIDDEDAPF